MTRQEITSQYSVNARGVICSPGKFEGENMWAPAVYEIVLDGFAESLTWPDDETTVDIVTCDGAMRAEFPELDSKTVAFSVEYSSQGFVFVTQMDAAMLASVERQNERAWEQAADAADSESVADA